jgi:hypothetical protein
MALSDKNIVITPNIGQSADPTIVFSGADSTTSAQNIALSVYPASNGTLSFDGSAGQLFSITNSLTGSIFSVNDVSGIPSIEVLDTGAVKLAQYGGNVGIGVATPGEKLEVSGNVKISGTTETLTKTSTIDGWTYSGKSISVSAQETASRGLSFSTDGTKMYIVGQTNDTVYQYTLSTPFDVSTATYASKSFSVSAQDTASTSIFFKSDGLAFYMLGDTVNTVFQYTLSTAWDVSTATYATKSFSVTTQETAPSGLEISPDGTKMYVIGTTNDTVYQYTLSTAWDVSTATYATKSFSVTTFDGTPTGIEFNADGTKMYVVGSGYDCIIEYTLSTAWDVSTSVFTDRLLISNGISVINPLGLSIANAPHDIYTDFSNNVAYIFDLTTQRVFQYTTNTTPLKVSGNKLVVSPLTYFKNDIETLGSIRALGSLEVTNAAIISSTLNVGGTLTSSGTLTAASTITLNGSTTSTTSLGTAASTGTTQIGGTTQTGTITVGQSTVTQTLNLGTGATTAVSTKTINIGTAGVSGSNTNINIGSAVSGAVGKTVINTNVGIGASTPSTILDLNNTYYSGTPTTLAQLNNKIALWSNGSTPTYGFGVSSNFLNITAGEVAGGIRFSTGGATERMRIDSSGNVGIGTSSPITNLDVNGNINFNGFLSTSSDNYLFSYAGGTYGQVRSGIYLDGTNSVLKFYNAQTESMCIDSSGNLGLGVTPSAWSGYTVFQNKAVSLASAANVVGFLSGNAYSDGTWKYVVNGAACQYAINNGGEHRWFTAPSGTAGNAISFTQAMTLDASGNLGIGTSSPSNYAKLAIANLNTIGSEVNISTFVGGGASEHSSIFRLGANQGSAALGCDITAITNYSYTTGTALSFSTTPAGVVNTSTPTERMRIDSSGNLGLGVTPSAWGSPIKNLDINTTGGFGSYSNGTGSQQVWQTNNAYLNSSLAWVYKYTGVGAFMYNQDAGHRWYTAPSGTAGNAISFTQAMTLDASGNLGIGTSSPTTRLQIDTSAAGYGLTLQASTQTSLKYQLGIDNASNFNIYDTISAAKRLVIDPNGNVGIGTSSPTTKLAVVGSIGAMSGGKIYFWDSTNTYTPYIQSPSGDVVAFFSNAGSERMRIDSSGNVGIGTSSTTPGYLNSTTGVVLNPNGSSCFSRGGADFTMVVNNNSGSTYNLITFRASGNYVGQITSNGTTTSYTSGSDYRLKNNISPMIGALEKVALLKPCTYKWNANGSDGQGFIAHELAEIIPSAVVGEKDAVDAEGNPVYQGVDTSFLVATLTAAIQEQQAIIELLTARLETLEGKIK